MKLLISLNLLPSSSCHFDTVGLPSQLLLVKPADKNSSQQSDEVKDNSQGTTPSDRHDHAPLLGSWSGICLQALCETVLDDE